MTNAKRRRLWLDRVADYRASELSVREWCARNGVSANALRYWLKRIGVEAEAVEWAPVEVVEGPASIESSVESQVSVRVGSATIDVRSGFDANLFADVLRVVVAVSASMESVVNPDGRSPRC
jgi:transposase-like protein